MRKPSKSRLKWAGFAGGALVLILLLLYMTGFFVPDKVGPGTGPAFVPEPAGVESYPTAIAERTTITEFYEAVGTVRPLTETRIESLVHARIREILVRPGDRVEQDEPLVLLDSREIEARLEQTREASGAAQARVAGARQEILAAEAVLEQAQAHHRRIEAYAAAEAATAQDLEQAVSGLQQAKARREQAGQALAEAQAGARQAEEAVRAADVHLGYTRILAPEDGQIVERLADPGDLAFPGKTLLTLQTPGRLRIEAYVREGLLPWVRIGQELACAIPALGRRLQVEIQEIVPAADPSTRSILVKAALPSDPSLFPGMFGRLLVPVKERPAILIPRAAPRTVGQLHTVLIQMDGRWQEVLIKTGPVHDDRIEVLSGLEGGEVIALRGERE